MSLKIGTNFNYQGHDFLDYRQGLPKTLEDLRNWDILVPLGFEACVDGEWYMWKGEDYVNPETGHWEKRSVSMGNNYDDAIAKLMAKVFPASFSVSGGGTYEKGQSVVPTVRWSLTKEGVAVPIDIVWINNSMLPDPNVTSYTDRAITSSTTYNVRVKSSEGAEFTDFARWTFSLKRYWGVSNYSAQSPEFILPSLAGLSSEFASDWKKEQTQFDCSGGKYPMYILPAGLYSESTFQVWVGGLRNTDLEVRREVLVNGSGSRDEYVIITLGTRQTGVLGITFKQN